MCNYTGGTYNPLRHRSLRLTEEAIVEMVTTLVNSKYEDCSKVGLNPFCKLNPDLEVNPFHSPLFSVVKYLHDF